MATEQEQSAVIRALHQTSGDLTVIDLGAHHGEEYQWIAGLFGVRKYIAVEADPRNACQLRYNLRDRREVTIIECAIAAQDGAMMLHLCDNETHQAKGSSSTHRPTGHLEHFPWCTFEAETTVAGAKLDSIVTEPVIDLLWADLQGAERDMIAGGTETLKRVRFLMIEAEEIEFYEGQALKPELISLLPDFEVVDDFGYNLFMRNTKCRET